jgi:hypothetical protein
MGVRLQRSRITAGPLLDALEKQLKRMSGVTIPRESWDLAAVPEHLKISFRVVDDKGKPIQASRDLVDLQQSQMATASAAGSPGRPPGTSARSCRPWWTRTG